MTGNYETEPRHEDKASSLNFSALIEGIQQIDHEFTVQANRAVNVSLTLRNWCVGAYIHEYELNGSDRAEYGNKLITHLADALKKLPNCNRRQLYHYLNFYRVYPQIGETVTPQLNSLNIKHRAEIVGTVSAQLVNSEKVGTASPQSRTSPARLIKHLSYSHFELLVSIEESTKRQFYEMEAMRGVWSVRELKRQINSLFYERSGLSQNKEKLVELAQSDTEKQTLQMTIRDPYVFEFLGLKSAEVMSESALEDQLLSKLEGFLLELGQGFCFEARQKRILIGESHNFVDLVFYHRILKCHVLVELKLEAFSHQNIGQLNTYVNWYKKHMMSEGDNPPVGLLLCTDKDHALAEYALAGLDQQLFVSKYLLELPNKEAMSQFIEEQLRKVGGDDEK